MPRISRITATTKHKMENERCSPGPDHRLAYWRVSSSASAAPAPAPNGTANDQSTAPCAAAEATPETETTAMTASDVQTMLSAERFE